MCATGQICERYMTPTCANPDWAEWPMPNGPADVGTGAPNPASYTDNLDGTVTDNVTKLMWQQAEAPGYYSQADALAYCSMLSLGGHRDWRLPSAIEIVSIVDYGQSNSAISATLFPTLPDQFFWSSTLVAGSPSEAWGVYFGLVSGSTSRVGMAAGHSVRCVR